MADVACELIATVQEGNYGAHGAGKVHAIDWFNHRRLHGEIGLIPPAEPEANHYRHNTAATTLTASVAGLH